MNFCGFLFYLGLGWLRNSGLFFTILGRQSPEAEMAQRKLIINRFRIDGSITWGTKLTKNWLSENFAKLFQNQSSFRGAEELMTNWLFGITQKTLYFPRIFTRRKKCWLKKLKNVTSSPSRGLNEIPQAGTVPFLWILWDISEKTHDSP